MSISSTQNCQNEIAEIQQINVNNNRNSNINIGNIEGKQSISANTTCIQTNDVKQSVTTAVQQAAKQVSTAISGFLALSSSDASEVADLTQKVATTISDSFTQNCLTSLTENQTININDNSGSVITAGNVNFQQSIGDTVDCVSKTSAVQQASSQLKQKISQKATAITLGIMGPLLLIIIVIVIIILVVVIGGGLVEGGGKSGGSGGSESKSVNVIGIVISVLFVYLVVAFFLGWFPFKKKVSLGDIVKDIEKALKGIV